MVKIDPDAIKEMMPEYSLYPDKSMAATHCHREPHALKVQPGGLSPTWSYLRALLDIACSHGLHSLHQVRLHDGDCTSCCDAQELQRLGGWFLGTTMQCTSVRPCFEVSLPPPGSLKDAEWYAQQFEKIRSPPRSANGTRKAANMASPLSSHEIHVFVSPKLGLGLRKPSQIFAPRFDIPGLPHCHFLHRSSPASWISGNGCSSTRAFRTSAVSPDAPAEMIL